MDKTARRTMGFICRLLKTTAYGSAATAGTFYYFTKDSRFVPLSADDHLFRSSHFRKFNPKNNPTTHDYCVRKVPLSAIDPRLLQKPGALVEGFCASVWGGLGL